MVILSLNQWGNRMDDKNWKDKCIKQLSSEQINRTQMIKTLVGMLKDLYGAEEASLFLDDISYETPNVTYVIKLRWCKNHTDGTPVSFYDQGFVI